MAGLQPVTILFTGGINNIDIPLRLHLGQNGETQTCENASTVALGRFTALRPFTPVNTVAEPDSVHSIFVGYGVTLVGTGDLLKYLDGASLTTLFGGLSGGEIYFAQAGNWVYLGGGASRKAVYLPTPVGTDWGQAPPTSAPTVAPGAAAGNPNGTYSCYYRYKITLPDGAIIRTALSPVGTVVTGGAFKIKWSGLVHSTFVGATTREIELFRTATGFSAIYYVSSVPEGTTTRTDNLSDATLQTQTEFAETGYYPPPDNITTAIYHSGSNRMFAAVSNSVYWSEAGQYHIFYYDETNAVYDNVNDVYLSGEPVTAFVMWDEQLYVGSSKTWRRLRGNNPDYWMWESIGGALKGPVSQMACCVTPWGIVYVGSDTYLWIFNGYESRRFAETFVFTYPPYADSLLTFDGRNLHLFYSGRELIIDMFQYPAAKPRITESTRTASAVFYDSQFDELYIGTNDGYLKETSDWTEDVTLSFLTGEIPVAQLVDLGDAGALMVEADTQGDELIITPYQDGEAQDSLTPVVTTKLERVAVPLPINTYRSLSFGVSITTHKVIELREPWFLRNEEDS